MKEEDDVEVKKCFILYMKRVSRGVLGKFWVIFNSACIIYNFISIGLDLCDTYVGCPSVFGQKSGTDQNPKHFKKKGLKSISCWILGWIFIKKVELSR
jgi:hypothetical protein